MKSILFEEGLTTKFPVRHDAQISRVASIQSGNSRRGSVYSLSKQRWWNALHCGFWANIKKFTSVSLVALAGFWAGRGEYLTAARLQGARETSAANIVTWYVFSSPDRLGFNCRVDIGFWELIRHLRYSHSRYCSKILELLWWLIELVYLWRFPFPSLFLHAERLDNESLCARWSWRTGEVWGWHQVPQIKLHETNCSIHFSNYTGVLRHGMTTSNPVSPLHSSS